MTVLYIVVSVMLTLGLYFLIKGVGQSAKASGYQVHHNVKPTPQVNTSLTRKKRREIQFKKYGKAGTTQPHLKKKCKCGGHIQGVGVYRSMCTNCHQKFKSPNRPILAR